MAGPDAARVAAEAARRRTFAIISHPDAGKTTLTVQFLLYAGAITSGGSVKAHEGRRAATSDWMDMEQKRGISITSTALNFPYRDHELNLLDTPGHRVIQGIGTPATRWVAASVASVAERGWSATKRSCSSRSNSWTRPRSIGAAISADIPR